MKKISQINTRLRYNLVNVQQGFTLIELLVVIVIIGILIGISLFGLSGARESGRDTRRKSDLETIRSGLELYKADCGYYPTAGEVVAGSPLDGDGSLKCPTANIYISSVPADPVSGRLYPYNTPFVAPASTYTLCASLEGGGIALIGCGSCGTDFSCNYKITNP